MREGGGGPWGEAFPGRDHLPDQAGDPGAGGPEAGAPLHPGRPAGHAALPEAGGGGRPGGGEVPHDPQVYGDAGAGAERGTGV